MRSDRQRPRSDRGSAAIEFVGFLPILLVTTLVLIHGAVALYAVVAATTAARHAARAAALGGDPAVAARAALPSWLPARVSVPAGTAADEHAVLVRVDVPDIAPGMDIAVERSAVLP